jgi:hypothetical protein
MHTVISKRTVSVCSHLFVDRSGHISDSRGQEQGLRSFDNREMRGIFGPKEENNTRLEKIPRGRYRLRFEDNIKMILEKYNGFVWLMIGTSGGLL